MGRPGTAEIIMILIVLILLFGAKKLPDTARGLGRSLRIFKAETKGLRDDDTSAPSSGTAPVTAPHEIEGRRPEAQPAPTPAVEHRANDV